MIDSNLYCVVMAGGQGTRFWPESTVKKPKQYLSLIQDESLLRQTLRRFEDLVGRERRFIVTTQDQKQLALEHSQGLVGDEAMIFEPAGRNTAPCILLTLASLLQKGMRDEDVVAIVPSDHVILNKQGFQDSLKQGFEDAVKYESIVTIGIKPNFPHTGYGYIEEGEALHSRCHRVKKFKEKPDFETAKTYVERGDHYWNSGMFIARLDVLLEQFKDLAPGLFEHFAELKENLDNPERLRLVYEKLEKVSIDYAVMEKSQKVVVEPALFDWNDLGSWDALESVCRPDEQGNTVVSTPHSYIEGSKGNIVFSPEQFVSLVDVNDLVVAITEDGVLVSSKKSAQKVKNIVQYLKGLESDKS
jgi:mannose-1-phosphate guanylyltransferase